jgi:hypothetical protein
MGSASGNSGMIKIYEICGRGEEKISQSDWLGVTECFNTLKRAFEKLKVEASEI